jgi:hypothetical protein
VRLGVGGLCLEGEIPDRIKAEGPSAARAFLDGQRVVVPGVAAKAGDFKGSGRLGAGHRRGGHQQRQCESTNSHAALGVKDWGWFITSQYRPRRGSS